MAMIRKSRKPTPAPVHSAEHQRRYLDKYLHSGAAEPGSGEVLFLGWLENLNEADWEDLLGDLLQNRPEALEVVSPPRGDDPLAYAAVLFDRVGGTSRNLLRRAMDRLLQRLSTSRSADEPSLLQALAFSGLISDSVTPATLMSCAVNRSLSAEARFRAAAALAAREGAAPVTFWQQIELDHFPELSPAVVTGLTAVAPQLALSRLLELAAPPPRADRLEYPLRLLLRNLRRTQRGFEHLRTTLDQAPNWLAALLREVLDFAEFGELRAELCNSAQRADGESKPSKPYSIFSKLIDFLEEALIEPLPGFPTGAEIQSLVEAAMGALGSGPLMLTEPFVGSAPHDVDFRTRYLHCLHLALCHPAVGEQGFDQLVRYSHRYSQKPEELVTATRLALAQEHITGEQCFSTMSKYFDNKRCRKILSDTLGSYVHAHDDIADFPSEIMRIGTKLYHIDPRLVAGNDTLRLLISDTVVPPSFDAWASHYTGRRVA